MPRSHGRALRRRVVWMVPLLSLLSVLTPVSKALAAPQRAVDDFNADTRTDVAVYRPATGTWYVNGSGGVNTQTLWGIAGDVPVAADYDGDTKTDVAVYRPATGTWYVNGSGGVNTQTLWGIAGDVPVPADYDGDKKADMAVYRPSSGQWFIRSSQTGLNFVVVWGVAGDVPVPADYDGDGKADIAVYRPTSGTWYVRGSAGVNTTTLWGVSGDMPVPADYDGDGRTDVAVYRSSTGQWFIRSSITGYGVVVLWGSNPGDVPMPGDYDGDGKADVAVYRPLTGTWYVNGTTGVNTTRLWGTGVDVPLSLPWAVYASRPPTILSNDPFTDPASSHRSEVEPDSLSFGSTVVSAFQVGRFFNGGSSNIGWATSFDAGASWTSGFMPGITKVAGGPYDRATDPSVAYDPAHNVWIVSSLALVGTSSVNGAAVVVNRSTDGGLTWGNAVTVAAAGAGSNLDKNWTICDTTPTSPFYGHCYTEWDDNGSGNLVFMSTSVDGGLTWSTPATTADSASGLGAQPLVKPDGTVVVPMDDGNEANVRSFVSTNGGASWGATVLVSAISAHGVGGNLRAPPLISAEMDGSGKTYVVWQDCRFEPGCPANDIVMSTSTDGVTWSPVTRIPIDPVGSGVDHFTPGIGVDRSTSGAGAHLGLAYYYYPVSSCTTATCQLDVGFVSSPDGGAHWSAPAQLAGPMSLSWLPDTSQGVMVGDYISTSFAGGTAHPVFAVARPPSGSVFDQSISTVTPGLPVPASAENSSTTAGAAPATSAEAKVAPVPLTAR